MEAAPGSLAAVLDALGSGLPRLIVQVVACAMLLAVGVAIYVRLTPFHEREMVAHGNAAAGTMLAGAILALAIPLAAMLATSGTLLDVVVWGIVALMLQLITLGIVALAMRNFRGMIESARIAPASSVPAAALPCATISRSRNGVSQT